MTDIIVTTVPPKTVHEAHAGSGWNRTRIAVTHTGDEVVMSVINSMNCVILDRTEINLLLEVLSASGYVSSRLP